MITYSIIAFIVSVLIVMVYFSINFKVPLTTLDLVEATQLYSDRPYCIKGEHPLVGAAVVIKIPRHLPTPIYLHLPKKSRVVRLLSDVNPNLEFKDWLPDTISISAPGSNYPGNLNNLTRSVSKVLDQGDWKIPPGGPKFSAPILIEGSTEVKAYTVKFFNKLVGAPSRNKKKLLGAFLFIVFFNVLAFFLYS